MARMTTARATDRESMMTITCRGELSGIFQPVGNVDTSKSPIDDGSFEESTFCPAAGVGQGPCL